VLILNDLAKVEIFKDPDYIHKIMGSMPPCERVHGSSYSEVPLKQDDEERYLAVNSYFLEWNDINAVALVIDDISNEKKQSRELEDHAYRDSLTNAYNRFYGMLTLSEWVSAKKRFTLVFVDLDSLKYINDEHGHNEGDEYIIRVANHLGENSPGAVVCRLGGDEFMLIMPDEDEYGANACMVRISNAIENDQYLNGKDYQYSISFGVVAVEENNDLPSSSILSIADERMYEHKRARKKERRDQKEQ